jgi:hypothetical protein
MSVLSGGRSGCVHIFIIALQIQGKSQLTNRPRDYKLTLIMTIVRSLLAFHQAEPRAARVMLYSASARVPSQECWAITRAQSQGSWTTLETTDDQECQEQLRTTKEVGGR